MPTISRRTVLARAAAISATQMAHLSPLARAAMAKVPREDSIVGLNPLIDWNKDIATVSPHMIGLSYESEQLGIPDFFSAANTELIGLFKELSPHGILRLGGNLSEFTQWAPDGAAPISNVPFYGISPSPNAGNPNQRTPVTPEAIRNLTAFLHRTGWRTIYGLNLALADLPRVVAEAKFVAETLGPHLIALQIGNEPNHYVLNHLRPAGYSFSDYFDEWSHIHKAILEALPTARFAGPDVAEGVDWIQQFAQVAPKSVVMLTGHHYAEGPPSSPSATIANLLASNPAFHHQVAAIERISLESRLPFVMAETNSCYNGGKSGLSNVFASALWAADYVLQLAQAQEQGVCFHGGGTGLYTPIAGGSGKPFHARPIYYGLLFCRELLGCNMIHTRQSEPATTSISTYAFDAPDRIVVINKSGSNASLNAPQDKVAVKVRRLIAPSPKATTDVRITTEYPARSERHSIVIPPFSGAIITLGPAR